MSANQLAQYETQLENLLIRIAGITDSVLKEQCQEEYEDLAAQIMCLREEVATEEKIKDQSNITKYYRAIDFETFLGKIYGDWSAVFTKLRIRKPHNICDRRYMQIVADVTGVQFHLMTLNGYDLYSYKPKKIRSTVYVTMNTFEASDETTQIMEHSGPQLGYHVGYTPVD